MRTKGVEYIWSHREQWFIWTTVWPHHKAYTQWTSVQDWECVCQHFMWLFMALHLPLGCIQVMSVALVFSTLGHPTVSIPTLERVTSFIPIVGVVLHSPVFWIKQSSLLFFSWVPSLTQGSAPDRIRGESIFHRLLDKEPLLMCSIEFERM